MIAIQEVPMTREFSMKESKDEDNKTKKMIALKSSTPKEGSESEESDDDDEELAMITKKFKKFQRKNRKREKKSFG